jgi:hypothetical protein
MSYLAGRDVRVDPDRNRSGIRTRIDRNALYQTWLAEGYAKTGDLDTARSTLDRATTTQAHSGSVRLQRRVRAVANLIDRRSGRHPKDRPTPAR